MCAVAGRASVCGLTVALVALDDSLSGFLTAEIARPLRTASREGRGGKVIEALAAMP